MRGHVAALVLHALQSPAYRRIWLGSFVANLGLWIQTVALGWLVYGLTRSASWLGAVSFAGNAPILFVGLLGGAIADRKSRRTIMAWALVVLSGTAATLSALTFSGHLGVEHILALAIVSGTASALYTPAMHSLLPSLVDSAHLTSAVSLNSVQFNLARTLGPVLAGTLYGRIGPAGCFALNSLGFLVMLGTVLRLRFPATAPGTPHHSMRRALGDGLRYARRHPLIGPLVLLTFVLSLFGFPYIILLPAIARDVLHLQPSGLGVLTASVGSGAVVGGLAMSALGAARSKARLAVAGTITFGIVLSTFALVHDLPATAALLFTLGCAQTVAMASVTTTVQLAVDDGMRGRVTSILTVILFGVATLGGFVLGAIGDAVGVPNALSGGGMVVATMASLVWARTPALREGAPRRGHATAASP